MPSTRIFRGTDEAEAARRAHERSLPPPSPPRAVDAEWLVDLCREAGAADAGVVEIERPGLGAEADHARRLFPATRTLVSLVGVVNPDAVRSVSRSVANVAWKQCHADLDVVQARVIDRLRDHGIRAVSTAMGFPMDQPEPGEAPWQIAHKVVAVEAGMGHMGVHRNVIHPRFGNFVLLETLLVDSPLSAPGGAPLDFNPCAGCNLCVAACPVGAVRPDDDFDFFACLSHNYREFLFGFEDWVDTIADATDAESYKAKFTSEETRSMWQSLGFGPNYKAAYCMAVCPAGDDVISPYVADRAAWRRDVALPLIRRREPVYVRSGTRAERVALRNPAKRVRYLDFRPEQSTVGNLLLGIRHRFDPDRAAGTTVRLHLRLPDGDATVSVLDGALATAEGHEGVPDAVVTFTTDRYIAVLHGGAGRGSAVPTHEVAGDPAALGALLACLD